MSGGKVEPKKVGEEMRSAYVGACKYNKPSFTDSARLFQMTLKSTSELNPKHSALTSFLTPRRTRKETISRKLSSHLKTLISSETKNFILGIMLESFFFSTPKMMQWLEEFTRVSKAILRTLMNYSRCI